MVINKHKDGLIKLYNDQLYGSTEFMKLVLNDAINKLNNDVEPTKVEDWVVNIEKLWRKLL